MAMALAIAASTLRTENAAASALSLTVKPDSVDQRCLRRQAGDGLDCGLAFEGAVDVDIHYHRAGEVLHPA
jgi:hypothetical protein